MLRPRSLNRPASHATACAWACLAWLAVPFAADPGAASVQSLTPAQRACAERFVPERSMVQKQTVTVVSEAGWTRVSSRTVYWKRFDDGTVKVLFRVERPKSEAGLKVLVSKRDGEDPVLYVYSPDIRRARRIVGTGASNSVLGTDFSFEDAMHLQDVLRAAHPRRVDAVELDGQPAFVMETVPAEDVSAYSLIRTTVDERYCLPIRTEFIGRNGSLDKTLIADRAEVREIGGRWVPLRMVMFNHKQHSRTELLAAGVEIDVELPDSLFGIATINQSE